MTQVKFDPTWNHIPRTAILYSLPLAMFSACLYVHGGWIGWSRDFWVPFLWGLVIPLYNTRYRAGRGWALKDFMNRDMYPPTLALTYATAWYLSVTLAPNLPLAMVAFFVFFHVFDGLLLHYEILNIYALSVDTHKRGVFATLLAFGPWWYTYISGGFAAVHALGADTLLSIGAWSLAVMLPMQAALTWWLYYHDTPQWFAGITNVAVLGGGWSGIYTTKWLTECGLQATCFEATDHIGGVWKYREDRPGGVFKNTRATASKHFLHASDFPMDPATPEFPYHAQILAYLQRYVEHFGIRECFRLNTRIVHVGKEGEAWRVVTESAGGEREETLFDAVVVCSGPHQRPRLNVACDPLYSQYEGKMLHAAEYKHETDIEGCETVLVVGMGESASDIVHECVNAGAKVYWASRRGQWFADRTIGPYPADHFNAFGVRALFGRFFILEYLMRRFWIADFINTAWGRAGHGIAEWLPEAPYLHQFVNKSRDSILDVYSGKVIPKRAPVGIAGKQVYFGAGEDPIAVDCIILATGYDPEWPFLDNPPTLLYKRVLHSADPTLAFVGFTRPIIGSIPAQSELQARWVANVWSGAVSLPCRLRRDVAMYLDARNHARSITDSSRLGVLTDHEPYTTQLASYVNAHVHWLKLLVCHPRAFFVVLKSPWIAFKYHLNDPDPSKRQVALQHIEREMPDRWHPVFRGERWLGGFILGSIGVVVLGLWYLSLQVVAAIAAAFTLTVSCLFRWTEQPCTTSHETSRTVPVSAIPGRDAAQKNEVLQLTE